jgi:GNAT superfamily N-acetyltransferase
MRIWRAAPEEAADVARLLAAFRDWWGREWPDDASFLASVERLIVRDDAEFLLAATGDDAPAGVVQLRYRWSAWTEADDCWLEDLYVLDSARGTGMGRALVRASLDRARERGCRRVELDVNTGNPTARGLYGSLGFETGKSGGEDLLMSVRLDPDPSPEAAAERGDLRA